MARRVYSKLLVAEDSVNGTVLLGAPPDGYLWVLRYIGVTIGSYFGYIHAAIGIGSDGPWQYITNTSVTSLIAVSKRTIYWEGRIVVPAGDQLWARVDAPDTVDYLISGYELEAD